MPRHVDNQKYFSFNQSPIQNLDSDWRALIEEFCADEKAIAGVFDFLRESYSEKHRFYHNLSHVEALLALAENLTKNFSDSDCVKLAIWFHDAVYDPQRSDNEIKSARLAVTSLSRLRLPENKIQKIEKMILATEKHDAATLDEDGKYF